MTALAAPAELVRDTAPVDDTMARAVALGTAYGQITYAMHCLREGSPLRAMEALQRGESAVREASPNLTDFWATFPGTPREVIA